MHVSASRPRVHNRPNVDQFARDALEDIGLGSVDEGVGTEAQAENDDGVLAT